MTGFILGQKSTQEQTFDESGVRMPVTHIRTAPCYLADVKTPEKDGYFGVVLAFDKGKNIKKPLKGKLEKAGIKTPLRFLREIRLDEKVKLIDQEGKKAVKVNDAVIAVGDQITPTLLFKKDEMVAVSGTSKGKGFAGVVKRHHFAGGPRTHGQSDRERAPGSIGQTTTPGRVYKGKRMAGRMGGETVTTRNLRVVEVKEDELTVKGLVPGAMRGLLIVKS